MIAGEEVLEDQYPDDVGVNQDRGVGRVGQMNANSKGGDLSKQ